VLNQWDLLTAAGIEPADPLTAPVEMAIDGEAARAVEERLGRCGMTTGDELIVIHVSAGNRFRRWPAAHFAALACALVDRRAQRRIVFTSGPSELGVVDTIVEEARGRLSGDRGDAIVSSGDFSLAELRALVARAALYIGGDSGPLHIAATTAVPIVGLYGPTLPARSAPWRNPAFAHEPVEIHGLPCRPCDQRVCRPGDFRCLTSITPADVARAAERALERNRTTRRED
jgi:ADP-heptose:LPS heptosyltransferase